jgi:hypothetical protein
MGIDETEAVLVGELVRWPDYAIIPTLSAWGG